MKFPKIPEAATNRLSLYLRCLNKLSQSGVQTISSEELAKRFNFNSALFRKDLAYFGEFGTRGIGYKVEDLKNHITNILGLNKTYRVCIIGAGHLGSALASYKGFKKSRFSIVALFDVDRGKIKQKIGSCYVYDFADFQKIVAIKKIDIAIIAVPASEAQKVLNEIAKSGIKAVLNFAPTLLKPNKNIKLKTVDLSTHLENLAFFLAQSKNGNK